MKRFIITDAVRRLSVLTLFTVIATGMLACAIPGTHNYYLFSTVARQEWSLSTQNRTMENWRAYAGKDDLYWFDADILRKAAQQKGDALMMSYIDNLNRYLGVAGQMGETWEYPTKQEKARQQQVLMSVQRYAFSKTKTRLRSQHALLYMRCNMMLGQHEQNVRFWEQTAQGFINSVYRDMMRNIYAGALLKTGRVDEATQIFAEQGDIESLYTYYYKKRSFEGIRQEYLARPNSAALPFLLQDFANNAQEAIDALRGDDNWPGKLFIRDIQKSEADQMCAFTQQVIREGKTENPALWKSLEAWLHYLFGSKRQALFNIEQAMAMNGEPRIKDNARALRLFIKASISKADASLDQFLADELTWLEEKAREERGQDDGYENHYTQVYDRLVHQALVPNYEKASRYSEASAFLAVYDEQPKVFYLARTQRLSRVDEYGWNGDYSTDFFYHIDEMPVAHLESYLAYTRQKPVTALDQWLSARIRHDDEFLHEVIGTKYLRLNRWAEAERHLEKVSVHFINTMNIAPFMAQRDFRIEPWMKRQRIKEELQMPGKAKVSHNQKLDFVREMRQLEQGYGTLEPKAKARQAYDLAIRYAQASFGGDAWYLTRYGKSVCDTLRADEANMLKKASELLMTAQSLDDFAWKEKTLFAQAYLPIDSWYKEEWSDQQTDYVKVLQKQSHQYKALRMLYDFEQQNKSRTSSYVSRCDVLKQFVKSHRKK